MAKQKLAKNYTGNPVIYSANLDPATLEPKTLKAIYEAIMNLFKGSREEIHLYWELRFPPEPILKLESDGSLAEGDIYQILFLPFPLGNYSKTHSSVNEMVVAVELALEQAGVKNVAVNTYELHRYDTDPNRWL